MKKSKAPFTATQFQQICITTQVCFVRNIAGEKFPNALTAEERTRLGDRIASTLCDACFFTDITHDPDLKGIVGVYLHLLPEEERDAGYHLLRLGNDFYCEVMATNHLTFTSCTHAADLQPVVEEAVGVIDAIGAIMPFAFHARYGYMTAQLPLVGTGFRVRSILHLAGLSHFNHLRELCNAAEFNGALVELDTPEPPPGHQVILFNRFSLGRSVEEILAEYTRMLYDTIAQEVAARQRLLRDEPYVLFDIISRCIGILNTAQLIPENEALDLLSDIRLATSLGILTSKLGKKPYHDLWFVRPTNAFINSLLEVNSEVLEQLPTQVADFLPWRQDALRTIIVRKFSNFTIKKTFIKRAMTQ